MAQKYSSNGQTFSEILGFSSLFWGHLEVEDIAL